MQIAENEGRGNTGKGELVVATPQGMDAGY